MPNKKISLTREVKVSDQLHVMYPGLETLDIIRAMEQLHESIKKCLIAMGHTHHRETLSRKPAQQDIPLAGVLAIDGLFHSAFETIALSILVNTSAEVQQLESLWEALPDDSKETVGDLSVTLASTIERIVAAEEMKERLPEIIAKLANSNELFG